MDKGCPQGGEGTHKGCPYEMDDDMIYTGEGTHKGCPYPIQAASRGFF